MWIKVKCLQDIVKGDVLSYDSSQQLWAKSSSLTTPLGVARKDAVLKPETDDVYIVEIQLQGQVEAKDRVTNMVNKMDEEGFGNCTNTGACEVQCPKGISLDNISRMNREFLSANLKKS